MTRKYRKLTPSGNCTPAQDVWVPEDFPKEYDCHVIRAYEIGRAMGAEQVRQPIIDALNLEGWLERQDR